MASRRLAREQALQLLYEIDLARPDPQQAMRLFWEREPADPEVVAFARRIVDGVQAGQARIDELLTEASRNWRLPRMSFVDRNILRIGVWEFLSGEDIPPNVTMNEAIELAKRFGTTESSAFVNGILDRVARNLGLVGEKQR
jgi:N utilization substance protein B